nr:amidohydrolase family protein [Gemmatimonadota bacterium]NIR80776.1 amidohydrolase family protein [Gemmatimonadota bacterium]NIT90296.1 amidohydrolase family protein [Gemmatimonadota bacterium]NIU33376.1 amidohydrolase family protein [Gemmatimonadota bacterium]NIU37665.1 amidohydrolase family protein [Gemmatimonadota bacterium]
PHGAVRREVLGMADRAPSPGELDRMRALVRRGMDEGAFGLSSGPFYAPGSYSDTEELVALAEVAAERGGVYTSHVRDESNYTIGVVAALDEVIRIAREAELPGIHTHIKALGPPVWGFSLALVRRIERARDDGLEIYADQYPYPASATGLEAALLPRWAQAGGRDSLLARLDRPAELERIRAAMVENLARRGGADRIQFRRFEPDPSIEGETLAQIAEQRATTAIEAAIALFRQGSPGIVSFNMHEDDVRTLMDQPWTMTSSDGGLPEWQVGVPHPRSYGAFPRKIRRYALEEGVVELEAAIRSMTSLPAAVFRIRDRGRIEAGSYADVVVFDLQRLRDVATFTEPHQLSRGMVHVFVNGEGVVRDGTFTDERAGRVLRRTPPGSASGEMGPGPERSR